jgi:hypothetical protein
MGIHSRAMDSGWPLDVHFLQQLLPFPMLLL